MKLYLFTRTMDSSGILRDWVSVTSSEVGSWDLHATATPGDYLEMETLLAVLPIINSDLSHYLL